MTLRCPTCVGYLIVEQIYDVLVSRCSRCGYTEPFAKKVEAA
jgi:DNA-directed RNA polymerase subunit M/transcription elongation factor TFIIS